MRACIAPAWPMATHRHRVCAAPRRAVASQALALSVPASRRRRRSSRPRQRRASPTAAARASGLRGSRCRSAPRGSSAGAEMQSSGADVGPLSAPAACALALRGPSRIGGGGRAPEPSRCNAPTGEAVGDAETIGRSEPERKPPTHVCVGTKRPQLLLPGRPGRTNGARRVGDHVEVHVRRAAELPPQGVL